MKSFKANIKMVYSKNVSKQSLKKIVLMEDERTDIQLMRYSSKCPQTSKEGVPTAWRRGSIHGIQRKQRE